MNFVIFGGLLMKKLKTIVTAVMASAMMLSMAVSASADSFDPTTPPEGCHFHPAEVVATSSCSHTGMKDTLYIGQCYYCGGPLYKVTCRACGDFLGSLCFCNM